MDDYLCKPFTLDALRTVLQRWLPAPAEAGDLDDRDSAIRHSA
jgi:hypothetical protein